MTVVLSASAMITGTVTFEGEQGPDLTQVRITAPATDQPSFGPDANAPMGRDGHFTLDGVQSTDFTVLAFPTDATLRLPQARQIMTARPNQTGQFQIRGLPPGEYYLATVDPAEQGEWFEPAFLDQHRQGAARVTMSEGDVKRQDFRVTTR